MAEDEGSKWSFKAFKSKASQFNINIDGNKKYKT